MIDTPGATKQATADEQPSSNNAQATTRATTSHIIIETNPAPPSYNYELQADDEWTQVVNNLRVQRQQLVNARSRGDEAAIIRAEHQVSESMIKLSAMAGATQGPHLNRAIAQEGSQIRGQPEAERKGLSHKPMAKLLKGDPSDSAVTTIFRGCLVVVLAPLIIIGLVLHGVGLLVVGIGKAFILFGDIVSLWRLR